MTSDKRIAANRLNAQKSTGPRTANGKATSSQNARRHGLATSVASSHYEDDVQSVLARLVAEPVDETLRELARRIAEATIDISRIWSARRAMLDQLAAIVEFGDHSSEIDPILANWQSQKRNPAAKLSRQPTKPKFELSELVVLRDRRSEQISWLIKSITAELMRYQRYERRAASRRKAAIRAFYEHRMPSLDSEVSNWEGANSRLG